MDIPPGCEVDGEKFIYCQENFEGEITIPEGIKTIESNAFCWCAAITRVHIPDGVAHIGWDAFMECHSLTDINIPASITEIGDRAFQQCSSLSHIHITSNATKIGEQAFDGCESLEYAIVPKTCHVAANAFPESCRTFNSLAEYRIHLAKKIAEDRAADGVEIVGMHAPDLEDGIEVGSGGRII